MLSLSAAAQVTRGHEDCDSARTLDGSARRQDYSGVFKKLGVTFNRSGLASAGRSPGLAGPADNPSPVLIRPSIPANPTHAGDHMGTSPPRGGDESTTKDSGMDDNAPAAFPREVDESCDDKDATGSSLPTCVQLLSPSNQSVGHVLIAADLLPEGDTDISATASDDKFCEKEDYEDAQGGVPTDDEGANSDVLEDAGDTDSDQGSVDCCQRCCELEGEVFILQNLFDSHNSRDERTERMLEKYAVELREAKNAHREALFAIEKLRYACSSKIIDAYNMMHVKHHVENGGKLTSSSLTNSPLDVVVLSPGNLCKFNLREVNVGKSCLRFDKAYVYEVSSRKEYNYGAHMVKADNVGAQMSREEFHSLMRDLKGQGIGDECDNSLLTNTEKNTLNTAARWGRERAENSEGQQLLTAFHEGSPENVDVSCRFESEVGTPMRGNDSRTPLAGATLSSKKCDFGSLALGASDCAEERQEEAYCRLEDEDAIASAQTQSKELYYAARSAERRGERQARSVKNALRKEQKRRYKASNREFTSGAEVACV
eukprot:gene31330-37859_t